MGKLLKSKQKVEDRFVKTYVQGSICEMEVIVDRETGVNYLFAMNGYAGGMTTLVDSEGRPIVTPISKIEE